MKVQKCSEFTRNLPIPTNLNSVHVKPLRGTSLFVFDPNLVFFVVDNLFGGDGRFHTRVEGRDFTQTEQRIIMKLLNLGVRALRRRRGKACVRCSSNTCAPRCTRSSRTSRRRNEIVIVTQFSIEFGSTGGTLHICMPYSMIEPIRDVCRRRSRARRSKSTAAGSRVLSQQVQAAEVEADRRPRGDAARRSSRSLNMRKGDVLPITVPEHVTAKVDGVPVMECGYGIFNGQYALRVQEDDQREPT